MGQTRRRHHPDTMTMSVGVIHSVGGPIGIESQIERIRCLTSATE